MPSKAIKSIKPIIVFADKKFFSRKALSHHISHTKGKRHICQYCGKSFVQQGELTIHLRMHTGERPFVCTVCGKAYKTSSMRTAHMDTHIQGKTFPVSVAYHGILIRLIPHTSILYSALCATRKCRRARAIAITWSDTRRRSNTRAHIAANDSLPNITSICTPGRYTTKRTIESTWANQSRMR